MRCGWSPCARQFLGPVHGIVLSRDGLVYVTDRTADRVQVLRRDTLETVGRVGSYGRQGGQLLSAHSMEVDQQGNIYVGETRGRRVQRFHLVSSG